MRPFAALSLSLSLLLSVSASYAATISTFAGTGAKGFSGEAGLATAAQLSDPNGVARGPDGALYICDTMNHRIRKVTKDGRIVTVAGTGEKGYSGDGGPALQAKLDEPYEIRFDASGNIVWVERLSHVVRQLDARTGRISTLAGTGSAGFSGDGGPAIAAALNQPHSLTFDKAGNLYIADVSNNRIRKVDATTRMISTLLGNGKSVQTPDGAPLGADTPAAGPRAIEVAPDGSLWLATRAGHTLFRLDLTKNTAHLVAGTGKKGFTGDGGPAKEATLNGPKGVAIGPKGHIYIVDTENHAIRVIDPQAGTIALVAGTGKKGDGPDGDPAACALGRPHGVWVDPDGAIFIGDTETHRVRVVRP